MTASKAGTAPMASLTVTSDHVELPAFVDDFVTDLPALIAVHQFEQRAHISDRIGCGSGRNALTNSFA